MTTAEELISRLDKDLTEAGRLTDDSWRKALYAVPRHLFVPPLAWCATSDYGYPIDSTARPEEWLNAAYVASASIITQLDDGRTDISTGTGDYSSSLSAPDVVIDFLELLDPYNGDEVLEIGTGSGWTAALLSHRLESDNVTSVEIDPVLARQAAKNVHSAGFDPKIITGDGENGFADNAPYDRVHVTCGIDRVPYAWVEQAKPGAIIAFPWMPGFEGGHKTRLITTGDGTAVGRFYGGASYMLLRSQRPPEPAPPDNTDWRESATALDPRRIVRASTGADVAIAAMLTGMSCRASDTTANDNGTFDMWLWHGDSRAQATYSPEYKEVAVLQTGPRDLWDETEAAFLKWVGLGAPPRERFGMTVTPERQYIWIDDPNKPLSPPS